jgi:hypothetical protein
LTGAQHWLNDIGVILAGAGALVYAVAFAIRRRLPTRTVPLTLRIRLVALWVVFLGALFEIAARV